MATPDCSLRVSTDIEPVKEKVERMQELYAELQKIAAELAHSTLNIRVDLPGGAE